MRLVNFSRFLVWVGRPRDRPIVYEDLVDAQTEVLDAQEALAQAEIDLCRRMMTDDALKVAAAASHYSGFGIIQAEEVVKAAFEAVTKANLEPSDRLRRGVEAL